MIKNEFINKKMPKFTASVLLSLFLGFLDCKIQEKEQIDNYLTIWIFIRYLLEKDNKNI